MHVRARQSTSLIDEEKKRHSSQGGKGLDWFQLQWQLGRPYLRCAYYCLFPSRRPRYFKDAWRSPNFRLDFQDFRGPLRPGSAGFTFFFLPMTDWHSRTQRSQHLAKAAVELGAHCVYVNPHLGLEYLKPYLLDPHTRVSLLDSGVHELHVHLAREHALEERLLTRSESADVSAAVDKIVSEFGTQRAALVMSQPVWLDVAEDLRHRYGFQILYDCHDWLPGFRKISPQIVAREAEVFESCDFTIFSSQHLLELVTLKAPHVAAKSALIRNAVDPRDFEISQAVAKARRPTVGYVGALDFWFDIDAVLQAASDHSGWKFVLLGRIEDRRIQRLRACENVELVGEVPYSDVARHLATWDAAMIPFLRNDLTAATNPLKLYEYFAVGLPVVSTALPEVELYKDLVYLANTPTEFSAMVAKAFHESDSSLRRARQEVALRETWAGRAQRLLEVVAGGLIG